MPPIKEIAHSIKEHIQDIGRDFKSLPKDIDGAIRNDILRQAQTMNDYGITTKLSQKELVDTLYGFHNSHLSDIKNGIAERLLMVMDSKNFPINVDEVEKTYRQEFTIETLYGYDASEIISMIQILLNQQAAAQPEKLVKEIIGMVCREFSTNALRPSKENVIQEQFTSDEIFSLKTYNSNIDSRRTNIERGKAPKDITLRKPNISEIEESNLDIFNQFNKNYLSHKGSFATNRLLSAMHKENMSVDIGKIKKINGEMKAIDEVYEMITYKFVIKIYQLLSHERREDTTQKDILQTAKNIFEQAKQFALNQSKEFTLQKLTPQDKFSLQMYNYNSNFWNTHIKDGNKLSSLILYTPHTPRPPKPDEPQKPKKSDFEGDKSDDEFFDAYAPEVRKWDMEMQKWRKSKEYKERNEWTEKTEWVKDILKVIADMGPFTKISNGLLKRINAILERSLGAGVQHTIEAVFRPNILKMAPEEEKILEDIITSVVNPDEKNKNKHFIILNHETFANIPITIVKFMQVAHRLNKKNINEYFTTIIGPLLATHKKQNFLLNSLSSILVTHPADNRIPSAKRISSHQQRNAGSQLEKDFNKDNPRGQIYFCAPSGTRDIVNYGNNDDIPQIIIPNESRGSNMTTFKSLRLLHAHNPNIKFYAVSTNTTELKRPNPKKKVYPNNNKRNKNATVSMHIKEIDIDSCTDEMLIQILVDGITHPIPSKKPVKQSKNPIKRYLNRGKKYYDYDENGKINEVKCGKSAAPDPFKFMKKFTKTKVYSQTGDLVKSLSEGGQIDSDIIKSEVEKLKPGESK